MNYLLLGGAGFIGTNLTIELNKRGNKVTLVDRNKDYFNNDVLNISTIVEDQLTPESDFLSLTKGQDIVFHLVSFAKSVRESIDPEQEINDSINFTNNLLKACEINQVKKVIFISSGGAVYGSNVKPPINEDSPLAPISSYGLEKQRDEECFKNYKGDYCIARLANPYGKYQRVTGAVGAVTIFLYRILHHEEIIIRGDGNIIRDFVYIGDVINALINLSENPTNYNIYNVATGKGISINDLLSTIENTVNIKANVKYIEGTKSDVPINYLDVTRYENEFGNIIKNPLNEGINQIVDFYR